MRNFNLISVILPAYNCEKYIEESVTSILNQTYDNFELIIIDDGSTDKTFNILKSFKDSRVRLYKNKINRGIIYSLNKGIFKSKGQFVARADGDDICEKDRFKKQINFLNKNKKISILGTGLSMINDRGKIKKFFFYPKSDILIKWSMLFSCPISHPSVMIRKNILKKIKNYNSDAKYAEDYDLWSKLIHKGRKFENLPIALIRLRKHNSNITYKKFKAHSLMGAKISKKNIEFNFKSLGKVNFDMIKCIFSLGKIQKSKSKDSIYFICEIFKLFIKKNRKDLNYSEIKDIKANALKMIAKIWLRNITNININQLFKVIFKIFLTKNKLL